MWPAHRSTLRYRSTRYRIPQRTIHRTTRLISTLYTLVRQHRLFSAWVMEAVIGTMGRFIVVGFEEATGADRDGVTNDGCTWATRAFFGSAG